MKYTPLFSVEAWATQYYGFTQFAKSYYKSGRHLGLDVRPIDRKSWDLMAPFKGPVTEAGWDDDYGNRVTLYDQDRGVSLRFAHLDSMMVDKGDMISLGDKFGVGGNTGNSTARHVHIGMIPMRPYGVMIFGDNPDFGIVDPLPFLIGIGVHI